MMSTAEYLETPEQAAGRALAMLQQTGGLSAAAVWIREGVVWRQLAGSGAAAGLPAADALDKGRLPGPDGGALELTAAGQRLGWLVWRGRAPETVADIAALLAGHLYCAALRDEQAAARVANETMLEISLLAGEGDGLERILPRLHKLMSRLMDASNFYIALYDEECATLRFPFYVDRHDPAPPASDSVFPVNGANSSLTAWLIRGGKPMVLTRERILEICRQHGLAQPLLSASFWMGAPLVNAAGNLIGAVVLQLYDEQTPFSSAEQLLFMFAARHVGFALDRVLYRSQLERQVWLRTSELEGANARLRAEVSGRKRAEKFQDVLFRIAELSNTSLSLEAFLSGLHRLLSEMVAARNCLVALYDTVNDCIAFPYCADEHAQSLQPRKPGKGYIEQVLHSGRPLLIDPYGGDAGAGDADDGAIRPKSWLGVPLYCGHELLGVLAVQSYESDVVYNFRDQEVLEFVANNIGAALARVRALESLQLAYAELEQRVRERTSELDAVNAQLEFDSLHDPLTKLPNRSYLSKALRRAWDAYLAGNGDRFAVVFIDLDRFKLVNDTLGHLAGDHLLFEAGARIRACLRHYDFLARLGGDEFAVLMFGMDAVDECETIARRIVSEFERPVILAGREVFSTASVGVVLADREHYRKAEDLLRDADHAMYCTKQQGRQGYTLFSHQLRIDQADQLALESELRRALEEEGQLIPYYQPFIDAGNGKLSGFEALVRWQHPQRGLISPALFLPMAEESGLITRLDRYMVNAACAQLQAWRADGQVGEDIALHINLSSANFHDPDLAGWIGGRIAHYQLPPAMLHLEITESALIDQPDTAATTMQALHGLGVRLALDDFGTGYSALSYLHRYRFDVLKIDQSFVFDLDRKEESAAIVRAILALARALDLDVVAEGVETASQLAMLREMGCAKLQGFYFAAPAPAWGLDWARLARFEQEMRDAA
ncbi:diguanylate cyclase [Chromobacterium sp. ATCC 53434]|uniref:bifunctional diguanylate cyclase/phosphodiesterase n=1 Tax=Chromobacterium sp. (strain ATCC 53434 / SC 14030) TaxID=2059672 RepID=UPI000C7730EA|nr:EAL domain-containing protein [Chromobacterium sp. ATCC 53434]AUH52880.1 diguanylate cyclase [Chromobacterium sp. ATCC 53434]